MESNWLNELNAGDTVIVESEFGHTHKRLEKVDKVTATQIVIGGLRFRKSDGGCMGEDRSWQRTQLKEPRPGPVRELCKREIVDGITDPELLLLTLEQLQCIRVMIQDAKEAKKIGGGE